MYKSIELNHKELKKLDDGQGWYQSSDEVYLGGYLPDDDNNPAFDLCVNGKQHDNWIFWADMPGWLQKRLS